MTIIIKVPAETIEEFCEIISLKGDCPEDGCGTCIFNNPKDKKIEIKEVS